MQCIIQLLHSSSRLSSSIPHPCPTPHTTHHTPHTSHLTPHHTPHTTHTTPHITHHTPHTTHHTTPHTTFHHRHSAISAQAIERDSAMSRASPTSASAPLRRAAATRWTAQPPGHLSLPGVCLLVCAFLLGVATAFLLIGRASQPSWCCSTLCRFPGQFWYELR